MAQRLTFHLCEPLQLIPSVWTSSPARRAVSVAASDSLWRRVAESPTDDGTAISSQTSSDSTVSLTPRCWSRSARMESSRSWASKTSRCVREMQASVSANCRFVTAARQLMDDSRRSRVSCRACWESCLLERLSFFIVVEGSGDPD